MNQKYYDESHHNIKRKGNVVGFLTIIHNEKHL